jgi:methionyl-tRNA formyltransferase
LKIIYAGTPEFSVPALETLIHSGHEIIGVYTQPDRPSGRGQRLHESAVKITALKYNLPVFQPKSLRDLQAQEALKNLQPDIIIVAAYGLILPKAILESPKYGCINIHPSLLPRWRGATPIHRPILTGEKETGVTIMQMDEGLDTGAMLYKLSCLIGPKDNFKTLHDKLAHLGAESLMYVLDHIENLTPEYQDNSLACYAQKISKTDAELDWEKNAEDLERMIRGFYPAYSYIDGQMVKVWEAAVIIKNNNIKNPPGTILQSNHTGIEVLTGHNILNLQKLQLPGGKILTAREILNSRANLFAVGKIFSY